MCILQIGELVVFLSDELKMQYDEMPWHDIKSMRNIAAHQYHKFDIDTDVYPVSRTFWVFDIPYR